MKFIHCADLHFGIKKYGRVNISNGMNTRVEEDLNQFDKIIDYGIKEGIDLFMVAGDIFDKRKPDEIIQREFAKRIKRLIDNKITTILLMGNHEGVTAVDTAHCLSSIKVLTNSQWLHIVDENKTIEINGINIVCMPYYSLGFINEIIGIKKRSFILGHLEIKGAKQGGFVFDKGIQYEVFNNKKIKYVALGHIHKHQVIGRAVYSGSINKINFGDEGDSKGFICGEYDEEVKKCRWKFVNISSRKFLTINCIWDNEAKKIIKGSNVEGKIVRVNIEDKKGSSIIPVSEIKNYLDKKGAVIDGVNVIRNIKFHIRDIGYIQSKTPKQMLKRYLRGEKKSVIKRGIKLLMELQ